MATATAPRGARCTLHAARSHGRRDHIVVGGHGMGVHKLVANRLLLLLLLLLVLGGRHELGPSPAQLQRRVLGRHAKLVVGVLGPLQVAAHGRALVVAPVDVEEPEQQAQEDHHQDGGHDGRHDGGGVRVQSVGGLVAVRAVAPLGVVAVSAAGLAGGHVGQMAHVVVPGLTQAVRAVAAVARALAPAAREGGVEARARTIGTAPLCDARGQGFEDGDGARVDEKVLDVDLVVEVELRVVDEEGVWKIEIILALPKAEDFAPS